MRSKVINPFFIFLQCHLVHNKLRAVWLQIQSAPLSFPLFLLAVESELVACSAVIKRRWRYRAASQRLSVLSGVTRLTPSLTSLPKAARNLDSYIETCGPLWFWCGEMLNTDFRFQLFILLHHIVLDFHLIWDFNILKSSWVKGLFNWGIFFLGGGDLIGNGGVDPWIKWREDQKKLEGFCSPETPWQVNIYLMRLDQNGDRNRIVMRSRDGHPTQL